MKKILGLVIGLLLLSSVAMAQSLLDFPRLALESDVLYLFKSSRIAVGVGVNVATIYDVVEIRGEYAYVIDENIPDKAGLGAGVNIPKLINKLGGNWQLPKIIPSIGIVGLLDIKDKPEFEPAVYLTIVKIKF